MDTFPIQIIAHDESWGWGMEQRFEYGDHATGSSSRQLQGLWETSIPQKGEESKWDQLSSDYGSISGEFENIMQWDDSGAQEAFQIAKERYETGLKGLIYPIPLPGPDFYTQIVEWDTRETFDLPESAEALSARKEKKGQKRRGQGGRYQGTRRQTGYPGQQDRFEPDRWRQTNNDSSSMLRGDLQLNVGQSGWDQYMPDINGLLNTLSQDRTHSGWGEEQPPQLQLAWQGQKTGRYDWQGHPQTQPSYEGWHGLYNSSEQEALQGEWVAGNNIRQAPVGIQIGCSAGHHQANLNVSGHWSSGMGNVHSGRWMGQGQMDGQYGPHQSRAGHWQQQNRCPGNLQPAIGGPPDRTTCWGQRKQQWRRDR